MVKWVQTSSIKVNTAVLYYISYVYILYDNKPDKTKACVVLSTPEVKVNPC